MKTELTNFINEIAAGDESVYMVRGCMPLIGKMKELLGFKRWHTSISRPDIDPRWRPFLWSSNLDSYVEDVRVMSFNMLYANSLKEILQETGATFPNGWGVSEFVDTLMQLRREYKSKYLIWSDEHRSLYNALQTIAKAMINSLYYIVGNCGSGFSIPIGAHDIVAHAREKVTKAVRKISETAVVLHVNTDEIIYVGDQVEFDNVHHQKYKKAIFFYPNRAAYGNDITVSLMPRTRFSMNGWTPSQYGISTDEQQKIWAEKRIEKNVSKQRKSLNEYMNKTKEDVEAEIFLDQI